MIVAVGGGVTGSLAGFVAATFYSGVRLVHVPTTLLAMVGVSVSGRTGVDTEFGRDVVGVCHQPQAVLADVDTLVSLPPVHMAAGMAEVLKHGIVGDAGYFSDTLARHHAIHHKDTAVLIELVRRSVQIRSAVIAAHDTRQAFHTSLDFGRTMGSAFQALLGYELLCGEAVAIGMLTEARLGEAIGITEVGVAAQIVQALETFRLPTDPPTDVSGEQILQALLKTPNAKSGAVRFALPSRIGVMLRNEVGCLTIDVSERELRSFLAQLS